MWVDCGGTRGQREANTTWLQRLGEEEVARICKERELCREGCLEGVVGRAVVFYEGAQPAQCDLRGRSQVINILTSFLYLFPISCWGSPLAKPYWTSPGSRWCGPYLGTPRVGSRREKGGEWTGRGHVGQPASQGLQGAWGHNINKSPWRTVQTNLFFYVSPNNERKGKGFIMKEKSILEP